MTLNRVLEPEAMESVSEAWAYDTMDHGEVNRQFVDDLLAAGPISGEVLDLGTGTAQIPIELCRRHVPDVVVRGVDLSENMLEVARANVFMSNLQTKIFLELADSKKLPFYDGRFAVVMSNSIVHHVPEPEHVVREAIRVVRPGGLLFFRDLLRPRDEAALGELVDRYAPGANEPQRELLAASFRAALTLEEVRDLIAQFGFDRQTVQQTSDRHWTWTARKAS